MADDLSSPKAGAPEVDAPAADRKAELIRSIRGAGAMADHPLKLDPEIDLTQPIYEQVLELERRRSHKPAAG